MWKDPESSRSQGVHEVMAAVKKQNQNLDDCNILRKIVVLQIAFQEFEILTNLAEVR